MFSHPAYSTLDEGKIEMRETAKTSLPCLSNMSEGNPLHKYIPIPIGAKTRKD
jgi:hypothetical protein